jgi:hypothetical protein
MRSALSLLLSISVNAIVRCTHHEGFCVDPAVLATAVDRTRSFKVEHLTMLQRLLLAKSLSKVSSSASCDLAPFLSSCGSLKLQHAKAATAAEEVDEHIQQHNRQPTLNNSSSRLEVDSWGAVSSIPGQDPVPHLRRITVQDSAASVSQGYVNHDGMRVDDGRYTAFLSDAGESLLKAYRVTTVK